MSFGKSVPRGFRAMKNLIFICVLLVLCLMMSALVSSPHFWAEVSEGEISPSQSIAVSLGSGLVNFGWKIDFFHICPWICLSLKVVETALFFRIIAKYLFFIFRAPISFSFNSVDHQKWHKFAVVVFLHSSCLGNFWEVFLIMVFRV